MRKKIGRSDSHGVLRESEGQLAVWVRFTLFDFYFLNCSSSFSSSVLLLSSSVPFFLSKMASSKTTHTYTHKHKGRRIPTNTHTHTLTHTLPLSHKHTQTHIHTHTTYFSGGTVAAMRAVCSSPDTDTAACHLAGGTHHAFRGERERRK